MSERRKSLVRFTRSLFIFWVVFFVFAAAIPSVSAHTLDVLLNATGTSGNCSTTPLATPGTLSMTTTAGASVVVLTIAHNGAGTARAGGAPTFGGVTMTQANSTQQANAGSAEGEQEIWYLIGPPIGTNSFVIPNTGAQTMSITAGSFKAGSNQGSALDVANGANSATTATNPTATLTTGFAADVIVAGVMSGATTWAPTQTWGTNICTVGAGIDTGAQGFSATYLLQVSAGAVAQPLYTFATADDWATVIASFKAVAGTTLGDGTNPGNVTIAPGGAITPIDDTLLTTSSGTDAITAISVNLSSNSGVGTLSISSASNCLSGILGSIGGGTGSGIITGSNSISISSTNAGTGGTHFYTCLTPLSHANMPAVPGNTYSVTAATNGWTGTNAKVNPSGVDTSATVTIDNASPTSATVPLQSTAGNGKVTLKWTTTSGETTDTMVLRWSGISPGSDVPVEGTDYVAGNTIGSATVACWFSAQPSATALSKVEGSGGDAGCNSSLANEQLYSYKVFSQDVNGNWDFSGIAINSNPLFPTASFSCSSVAGTVNWSAAASWTNCNSTIPQSIDHVTIISGSNVTVDSGNPSVADVTIAVATVANSLTIATGQTLTVTNSLSNTANTTANGQTITINGTGVINAGSVSLTGNSSTGITTLAVGSGTLTAATGIGLSGGINATGVAQITASTGTITTTSFGITFSGTPANTKLTTTGAATINMTGTLTGLGVLSLTAGTVLKTHGTSTIGTAYTTLKDLEVVDGTTTLGAVINPIVNLTVDSGAILQFGAFAFTDSGTTSITGTINCPAASCLGLKTFTGAVTVNSGGVFDLSAATGGNNATTSFGGGITMNGTTFNAGSGGATQTGTNAFAGSSNMTFGGTLVVATLTNNNTGANGITVTGVMSGTSFTQGTTTNTLKVGAVPTVTTFAVSGSNNTVEYTLNGPFTCKSPATAYYNVTFSGASGAVTCSQTTFSGTVTVSGGVTWTTTNVGTVFGNFITSGTAAVTTGHDLDIVGTFTIGNGTTFTQGSTFALTLDGVATIGGGASGTIACNATAGTRTFRDNLVISTGATWTKTNCGTLIFAKGLNSTQTITGNATNADLGVVQISANGGTTTVNMLSSIKVTSVRVDASQTLSLNGSNTLTITGTGTGASRPFINVGTFTQSTGTVAYTGTSATEISDVTSDAITYNNLSLIPAGTVTYTLGTAASETLTVGGNLIVGNGTNALTATAATYNPIINVTGNTTVASGATFTNGTGAWNFTGDLTVDGTLNGSASNNVTVNGSLTGPGTVNISSLNFIQRASSNKNFGPTGSNDWQFFNLLFSNSNAGATPITITTQSGGSAKIKTTGFLILGGGSDAAGASTTLNAGDKTWLIGTASQVSGSALFNVQSQGLFTAATSTINFEGTGTPTIAALTYNNLGIGTISDLNISEDATLSGNTTVSNTLTIGNSGSTNADTISTSGTNYSLTAGSINITSKGAITANASTITLTGTSFTNNGTFTAGTSTLVLSNSGITTIGGTASTTFNNVTDTTAGSTVKFANDAGGVTPKFTFTGTVTITGAVGNHITITSNNQPTNAWLAHFNNATSTITHVTVSYSDCDGTSAVVTLDADSTLGSGNNATCWTIAATGITISGILYQNDGTTVINCSGGGANTRTVHIKVNGAGSYTGDCTGSGGTFSISSVTIGAINDVITVFLFGESEVATTITKAGSTSTNITDMYLYTNRITIRTETSASAMTDTNLANYDSDQDATNLKFDAETTSLIVADGSQLLIFDNATTTTAFTPGGTVTTDVSNDGTDSVVDGDLTIQSGATLTMGTNALSIGGDFSNSGTFAYSSGQTTTFTATATGFAVEDGTSNFDTLTFNGSGGEWTLGSAITLPQNLTVTAGTLVTASTITGASSKTFQVSNGAFFRLTGAGTFPTTFTTYTFQPTSTMQYQGNSITVTVATYGNLTLGGTNTYTLPASDITMRGDLLITSGATVTRSASNTIIFAKGGGGTQTLTDNANSQLGNIQVSANSGTTTLTLPIPSTIDKLTIDTSQTFNIGASQVFLFGQVTNNGTLTGTSGNYAFVGGGTGASRPFVNNGTFNSGTGTIYYFTDADTTIETTNVSYNNLVLGGSVAALAITAPRAYATNGALTVTGNMTIDPYNPTTGNTLTVTLGGNANITGNLVITRDTSALSVLNTSGTNYSITAASINIQAGGTLTANGSTITLTGTSFTNNGTFTAGTSTLVLSNSGITTIGGTASTTFNNVTDTTAGSTVKFANDAGGVTPKYTFAGTVTITGAVGNHITITSDNQPTNAWLAHFNNATSTITHVTVSYSDCDGTSAVVTLDGDSTLGSGNNVTCWVVTSTGVVISGTIYSDDGSAAYNCSTGNVSVAVAVNSTIKTPVTCNAAGGTYTLSAIAGVVAGDIIHVFIDTATGSKRGSVVTRALNGTAAITLNIYQQRVILRQEDGTAITNSSATGIGIYDADQNANIIYTANTNNLSLSAGKLIIWTNKSYTPGGTVTTPVSSTQANPDGDLLIQSGATLTMGTNAMTIGGDYANSGTLSVSSGQTTTFIATNTGFTITRGTGQFDALTFNGASGEWTLLDDSSPTGTVTVTAGTLKVGSTTLTIASGKQLSVGASGTVNGGSGTLLFNGYGTDTTRPFVNSGTFTASTGTVDYEGSSVVEIQSATYNNLNMGTTSDVTAGVTYTLDGTTTVSGTLALGNAGSSATDILTTSNNSYALSAGSLNIISQGKLIANASTITLTGSGTPFTVSGVFAPNTSTVIYNATSATNITATTYNNLTFSPASSATYTLPASDFTISGNLSVGANAAVTKSAANKIIFAKGSTQTLTDSEATPSDLGAVQVSSSSQAAWCSISSSACNSSWLSRKKITFNNKASAESLINFPVLVQLSSSNIDYSKTKAAGADIRFVDADGTTALSYEIESWNSSGTSYIWVKVPQIDVGSSTDSIWMYYNNTSATDNQAAASVWDTNFKGVWHLPNGTTLSATNSITGGASTITGAVAGTGQVGGDATFANTTDLITTDLTSLAVSATRSWSAWFRDTGDGAAAGRILDLGATTVQRSGATLINFFNNGDAADQAQWTVPKPNDSSWHHLVITYNSSSRLNDPIVYIDGAAVAVTNIQRFASAADTNPATVYIGNRGAVNRNWGSGGLDEARIADTIRSASWVGAEYLSGKNLMNSFGIEESSTGGATTLSTSTNAKATSLTVDASQNLDISSDTLTLTGTGTALTLSGSNTFTITGSTVQYTAATATVTGTTFNNLTLGGTGTYTLPAADITVRGDLVVNSTSAVTKSASNKIIFAKGGGGTQTVTGNATNSDLGLIQVSANSGATTLNLASSIKITNLTIDTSQIFSANGSNTLTITGTGTAGSRPFINNGTFTQSTGTVEYSGFGATTIETTNVTYHDLLGDPNLGVSGNATYTMNGPLNVDHNLTTNAGAVAAGTLTFQLGGTSVVTGTISLSGQGGGVGAINTDATGNYALTAGAINIQKNTSSLTANNSTITVTGSGTGASRPFIKTGTFTTGGSTFVYTGTSATEIESTTYNNLSFSPTSGSPTYTLGTAGSQTIIVKDFTLGASAAMTVTAATNNPAINITGNMTIATNTAYTNGTGITTFKKGSSQDFTNNGTLDDLGVVQVSVNSTNTTLNLGVLASAQVTKLIIDDNQTVNYSDVRITGSGTGTSRPLKLGTSSAFTANTSGSPYGIVKFFGTAATEVQAYDYDNLYILPASGNPTYTLGTATSQSLTTGNTANGGLEIGDGTNAVTVRADTYNPTITTSDITIRANATYTKGSNTITMRRIGGGVVNLRDTSSAGQDVGTVEVSGSGGVTTLQYISSDVKVTKLIVDSSQAVFSGSARTLTLTGSGTAGSRPFVNNGSFTQSDGTVNYTGTSATDVETTNVTYNNLGVGTAVDSTATTYTPNGNITIGGTLTIGNAGSTNNDIFTTGGSNRSVTAGAINIAAVGTLTANASTITITGTGFTNNGTFTAGTSTVVVNMTGTTGVSKTVTFDGSASTQTFNNFTVNNTPGYGTRYLKFKTTVSTPPTFVFGGAFNVTGSASNPVYLSSDTPGTQWVAKSTGTSSLNFVAILDSGCGSGTSDFTLNDSDSNLGNNNQSCWHLVGRGGGVVGNPGNGGGSGGGSGQAGGGPGTPGNNGGSSGSANGNLVQSRDQRVTSGTTNILAFNASNTAHNLIVVYVVWGNTGTLSIADSAGNTYTPVEAATTWNSSSKAQTYYAKNINAGANTITATFGTTIANFGNLYIFEYSGMDQTAPLDQKVTAAGNSTALSSGNVTTVVDSELIFGAGATAQTIGSAGGTFNSRLTDFNAMTEDKVSTALGTYSATASATTGQWVMQIITFKAAGSGGGAGGGGGGGGGP